MSWKKVSTIKRLNGTETFIYKSGDYKVEIDKLTNGQYVIWEDNFGFNINNAVENRAKTIKTLLNRLDTLFI